MLKFTSDEYSHNRLAFYPKKRCFSLFITNISAYVKTVGKLKGFF